MFLIDVLAAITEPLYHGQDGRDYLQRKVNRVLINGLTKLCKQKPEDPLVRACTVYTALHCMFDFVVYLRLSAL